MDATHDNRDTHREMPSDNCNHGGRPGNACGEGRGAMRKGSCCGDAAGSGHCLMLPSPESRSSSCVPLSVLPYSGKGNHMLLSLCRRCNWTKAAPSELRLFISRREPESGPGNTHTGGTTTADQTAKGEAARRWAERDAAARGESNIRSGMEHPSRRSSECSGGVERRIHSERCCVVFYLLARSTSRGPGGRAP